MFSNSIVGVPLQNLNIKEKSFDSARRRPPPICICYIVPLKKVMPIESIEYNVKINLGIAVVQIVQNYRNELDVPSDLSYLFSISPDSVFTKMEVQFGDKNLLGLIKEKEIAKAQYNQGVKEGKTMVYSEKDDEYPDLMRIKLGNLAPNSKLQITLEYTQPLQVCVNSFWKFSISPVVQPRYHLNNQTYKKAQNYINQIVDLSTINQQYKQNITVELDMPDTLTLVESPTHKILKLNVKQVNKSHKCSLELDPAHEENFSPKKPFLLLFATESLHKPTAVLTHTSDDALAHQKYCATVSFIPKFNPLSLNDAYAAFMQEENLESQEFEHEQKGEYIFLIDRSGSMGGSRMQKAKEALILFIRSLPQDSFFNIISFGSSYQKMWNNSRAYNSVSQEEAIKSVEKMSASLGGTEILKPFSEQIYKGIPKIEGYPRNIFLLTDGEVSPDPVVDIVRKNSKADVRVYTLGIGSDCSQFLIEKVAEVGNGKFQFVDDDENLNAKVIDLLEDSITPYLQDFKMETNIESPFAIVPNPESFVSLKKNQSFTCQILFSEPIDQFQKVNIRFECFDPKSKQPLGCQIELNIADSIENPHFHKLAAYRLITEIENASKFNDQTLSRCFVRLPQIRNQELIDLSLQHQILSRVTAFICEVVELNDQWKELIKRKYVEQEYYPKQIQLDDEQDFYNQRVYKGKHQVNAKKASMKCKSKTDLSMPTGNVRQRNTYDLQIQSQELKQLTRCIQQQLLQEKEDKVEEVEDQQQYSTKIKSEKFNKDERKDSSVEWNQSNFTKGSNSRPKSSKMQQIQQQQKSSNSEKSKKQSLEQTQIKFDYKVFVDKSLPDGSFEIDANIAGIIKLEQYSQLITQISKELLAQVLILWWLEQYCSDDKESWQLIYKKAIQYLKRNNVVYQEIKPQIKQI